MSDITPFINRNNIEYVRKMIDVKNSSVPFIANVQNVSNIITDMDRHPYSRYYRGVPTSTEPIFFEREAGWRIVNNPCYRVITPMSEASPNKEIHCFQNAATIVLPCHCDITTQYERR